MTAQKAKDRRTQIPRFEQEYGAENTVGLPSIILTDYMSSEHSDGGNADPVEYVAHRDAHGGKDALYLREKRVADASARRGKGRSKAGKARYPRYRGLAANSNSDVPPRAMLPNPDDFTIFKLTIPDTDLFAEDLGYLADREDGNNETPA